MLWHELKQFINAQKSSNVVDLTSFNINISAKNSGPKFLVSDEKDLLLVIVIAAVASKGGASSY